MAMRKTLGAVAIATGAMLAIAGCSSGDSGATTGGSTTGSETAVATKDPIIVGVVVSLTGNFATQAVDFQNGFNAALDYLTDGTRIVDGHPIEILVGDDTGDPAVGASKAKEFIGEGATIITGPTSSAVALAVADIARQNGVVYLPGTSGTADLVGLDPLVFGPVSPAGSQVTAKLVGDDPSGKKLSYIGQDYAYGQSLLEQTKAVLEPLGVEVIPYLLPQETTDFLPLTVQLKQNPTEFLLSTWAGAGQDQLYNALGSQGVLENSDLIGTTLLLRANWAAQAQALGEGLAGVVWNISYYPGVTGNEKDLYLQEWLEEHDQEWEYDLVTGWTPAEMIVAAVSAGATDPVEMAEVMSTLEWEGPAGPVIVRPEDNLITNTAHTARLVEQADGTYLPEREDDYPASTIIPPILSSFD